MKNQVSPYINFQGRCREAMELYQQALGGELELYAADEKGTPRPAAEGDRIQHARLSGDGFRIAGSDGHPSFPTTAGDNVALSLVSSDRAYLESAQGKLAEGGQLKMPLRDAAWGGAAGWLCDRFGINWNLELERA